MKRYIKVHGILYSTDNGRTKVNVGDCSNDWFSTCYHGSDDKCVIYAHGINNYF